MRIKPEYRFVKRMVLGMFLWMKENCRSRISKLDVAVEKLAAVGLVGEIWDGGERWIARGYCVGEESVRSMFHPVLVS